ncbi:MAG: phosphohistidine phosphatase SixA [Planctomycetes bacterium]|nr:phosphohistidine phosphatase SixA [Planctomycetota bacterium]
MRLYLVRHGDAAPGHDDSERHLSPRGRADVARLAERAVAAGVVVNEIRHSGLVRARETAEILAARLRPVHGVHEMPGITPGADEVPIAIEFSVTDDSVLLVSHMPFVACLAGRLVSGSRSAVASGFATSELRGFERGDDHRWTPVVSLRGAD